MAKEIKIDAVSKGYYQAKDIRELLSLAMDQVNDMQEDSGITMTSLEEIRQNQSKIISAQDERIAGLEYTLKDALTKYSNMGVRMEAVTAKSYSRIRRLESDMLLSAKKIQAYRKTVARKNKAIAALQKGCRHLFRGIYATARVDEMAAHLDKEDIEAELESYKELDGLVDSISIENEMLKKEQNENAAMIFDQAATIEQLRERLTEELNRNTQLENQAGVYLAKASRDHARYLEMDSELVTERHRVSNLYKRIDNLCLERELKDKQLTVMEKLGIGLRQGLRKLGGKS